MPDPHSKPLYKQVADELRRRINAGAIPPGAPLASETDLMVEFGASRGTIRDALAQLRAEGLVISSRGRPTYVRPVLPVRRRAANRYQVERDASGQPATAFTADRGIDWSAYELDREFAEEPAPPAVAARFGVEPGTPLLARRFVFRSHGVPQQISTSYYQLDMVAGTPLADPAREPWPGGNAAQLRSIGVEVTGIRELVRSRMPLADESEVLQIPVGTPVVTITRQTYAGDRVVEVADIVIPADRVELEYWIPLDQDR